MKELGSAKRGGNEVVLLVSGEHGQSKSLSDSPKGKPESSKLFKRIPKIINQNHSYKIPGLVPVDY